MDFVLFGLLSFYFARGFFKGFISMIFSLIGVFFVAIISWKLMQVFLPFVQNYVGNYVEETISALFNGLFPGQFTSIEKFGEVLTASKFGGLFGLLIAKLLGNITFDGILTAGQILAPSISKVLIKIVLFIVIFILIELILKILKCFINKIVKKCGLSIGNRVLGGVVGLIKGIFVFGVLFFVLSMISNLIMSEGLLQFIKSGEISNFLYESLLSKIIPIFY